MKLKLIPEWKDAWKWASTRCMTVTAVIAASWLGVPADLRASAPPWLMAAAVIGMMFLGFAGRITRLEPKPTSKVPTKKTSNIKKDKSANITAKKRKR